MYVRNRRIERDAAEERQAMRDQGIVDTLMYIRTLMNNHPMQAQRMIDKLANRIAGVGEYEETGTDDD